VSVFLLKTIRSTLFKMLMTHRHSAEFVEILLDGECRQKGDAGFIERGDRYANFFKIYFPSPGRRLWKGWEIHTKVPSSLRSFIFQEEKEIRQGF